MVVALVVVPTMVSAVLMVVALTTMLRPEEESLHVDYAVHRKADKEKASHDATVVKGEAVIRKDVLA